MAPQSRHSAIQGSFTLWLKVSAGSHHVVALKKDGTLWAWGFNKKGQLGDGATANKTSPVQIGKDSRWVAISAGGMHSLALKLDNTSWSWGGNDHGQLGDGARSDKTTPVQTGN